VATRRLTRAEQQAQTKARLLDAAVAVCLRCGLHTATLEEIAEEAGFSRGAVYSNFEGKDELLLALFEERIEPRLQALANPLIEADTTGDQAEAIGGFIKALLTDERPYVTLLVEYWGLAARTPAGAKRFARVRRRRRAMVEAMIEERLSQRQTTLSISPGELAACFVTLSVGVLFEGLVDEELDAERIHTLLFRMVARGSSDSQQPAH
jgi:AcrR family transcriptional regulator